MISLIKQILSHCWKLLIVGALVLVVVDPLDQILDEKHSRTLLVNRIFQLDILQRHLWLNQSQIAQCDLLVGYNQGCLNLEEMLYGFEVSFRFVAQIAQIQCYHLPVLTAAEGKQLAVHIDQQLLKLIQIQLWLLR